MVNRTERLLLALMRADGPLTSAHLAQAVGASTRTIKTEMRRVSGVLDKNGAQLQSRRNVGYSIQEIDPDRYGEFRSQLELKAAHVALDGYDRSARMLYIARRLVASTRGAHVDELCDELSLSRSAVRSALKEARSFCESFHLQVTSAAGYGMRAQGEEHMVRLALVELFEIHFHEFRLEGTDAEYAQWIDCDYQERQDIRHVFLKVLRESGVSLRDGATQRVAMYLVIARNRTSGGLHVLLPDTWVAEAKETALWGVAHDILSELSTTFNGFAFSEHETAFFALWMLTLLDVDTRRSIGEAAPLLERDVSIATRSVLRAFIREVGASISELPDICDMLEQFMLPLAAAARYGMDGCELFDYDTKQGHAHTPFCSYLAGVLSYIIEAQLRCTLSDSSRNFLAILLLGALAEVPIPRRPLRLLVANSMGTVFAQRIGRLLMNRFPDLIASCDAYELYEIRGLDRGDHDAVVTDMVSTYNYEYPVAYVGLARSGFSMADVHDEILIDAYRLEKYVPSAAAFHVYDGVEVSSAQHFIQALMLRELDGGGRCTACGATYDVQLSHVGQNPSGSCGLLFAPAASVSDERVDIYRFAASVTWGGQHVTSAVHARIYLGDDAERLVACERIFTLLTDIPDDVVNGESARVWFTRLLRMSFEWQRGGLP